jgi:hypothetical protein
VKNRFLQTGRCNKSIPQLPWSHSPDRSFIATTASYHFYLLM